MITISAEETERCIEIARGLKGSQRRVYMASVTQALGRGGQRYAEKHFGWNRRTIRKGWQELTSGTPQVDRFSARGRRRTEERLPTLAADLQRLAAQVASPSKSLRAQAREVWRLLVEQKGYGADELPAVVTIAKRLKQLQSSDSATTFTSARRTP